MQPLFPLADTPDVDLEQAGGTNVAGGETFATGSIPACLMTMADPPSVRH